MRKQIHQNIFLNKDDITLLKKEGITIQTPDGNSITILWDGSTNGGYRTTKPGEKSIREKVLEVLSDHKAYSPKDIMREANISRTNLGPRLYELRDAKIVQQNKDKTWSLLNGGGKSK